MAKSEVDTAFFTPHEEAAAIVKGKAVVSREVFDGLLPELRARAFCVTGVEGAHVVQSIRDTVASFARGQTEDGKAVTWDDAKKRIVAHLDEAHFSEPAAERRATLLLRTHGFQAFQAANWRVAQQDADTTHLQYLATEDARVRDSHLALNGIILPKSDPFWQKHYPPWEWGCRCRVRPMNPDMVDMQKTLDGHRKPEDRLVIEGPALQRLRAGQIVRGELMDRDGRTVAMGTHDVTPPSEGPEGKDAFQWHPDNLHLPMDELKQRYDPPVWEAFQTWAKGFKVAKSLSVWAWLLGRKA